MFIYQGLQTLIKIGNLWRVGHPITDHWPKDSQMSHRRAERRAKLSNTHGVYSSYGLEQEDTVKKSDTNFVPMLIDLQKTF